MRTITLAVIAVPLWGHASAAEPLKWVKKPELAFDGKAGKWYATFELDRFSDVEVSIFDPAKPAVVRHLAAGILGPKAPPPFAANSRAQKLEWDGKDDFRAKVARPESLAVRVRAGMSVALEQIVGGDPYAYFSEEMGHNDHSPFGINGLEAKPDGKVYVLGHSSNLGPPALRQYDIDGTYLRTVFPPPAGKDVKTMKGWGINLKPDGTYTPKFNRLTDPSLTTTFLDTGLATNTGGMARLFPTPTRDHLSLWRSELTVGGFDLMTINTDGTIPEDPAERLPGPLVKSPAFELGPVKRDSHVVNSLLGPVFTCFAPDGKHFYLSGLYAAATKYGSVQEIKPDGFWRGGQVWKVDAEMRTAKVFFALDEKSVAAAAKDRNPVFGSGHSYTALHGVAVDRDGNVFVCDRLNKRIVVLDKNGKTMREIPVEYPDAVTLSARTGALYATTRIGEYGRRGHVNLLKFNDWRKEDKPAVSLRVSETGYTDHHKRSYVVVCDIDKASNVWVAYTEMPVRIYRDDQKGFRLFKDFYRVEGAQRCLGFDRMEVDRQTGEVYVLDDHSGVWKVGNWKKPLFVKVPLKTANIAIDSRHRHVYARTLADGSSSNSVGKVARFHLDRNDYPPANFGDTGTNRVTAAMKYEWCFTGNGDKGIAVAPNGNLAVVGDPKDGLRVFAGSQAKVPWEATTIAKLPDAAGGVRFDFQGNLYVGFVDKKPTTILRGFDGDRFAGAMGRIHKYTPTGTLESGNLFPKVPAGPTKTYDVPYGAFDSDCITRTPRFGVDGFGRIYYPTNIAQRVAVMDNAGNEILHFGTYGNRDSMGGLPGDLVPTKGIPLAFPNSVDATDNHIYVADMVNHKLLRIEKKFEAEATSR